jgi:hypothetical protein
MVACHVRRRLNRHAPLPRIVGRFNKRALGSIQWHRRRRLSSKHKVCFTFPLRPSAAPVTPAGVHKLRSHSPVPEETRVDEERATSQGRRTKAEAAGCYERRGNKQRTVAAQAEERRRQRKPFSR